MIITDVIALSMLVCLLLGILAYKMRAWPVMLISSIGWMIVGLRIHELSGDLLPLGLIVMVAIAQIFVIPEGRK